MKIQTLDQNLRSISPNESAFLAGNFFDYSIFPIGGYYKKKQYLDFSTSSNYTWDNVQIPQKSSYENLVIGKNDRYQAVPLHIHPWIEMNYVYSGTCELTINDAKHTLSPGQMSLIDTNAPHAIGKCDDNDILINFIIDKQYLNDTFFRNIKSDSYLSNFFVSTLNTKQQHDSFIIFHAEKSERLPVFVQNFLCEYYDTSICSSQILDSLMTLIMCELINVFENDIINEQSDDPNNLIIPLIRYIENNFNSCTLESTAKIFNLHPNYLSAYIKKHTGHTYKELIQIQRLQLAASLLKKSNLSIYDICYHVGYKNTSFFYQKFEAEYKCTPKEYRDSMN